MSRWRLSGFFSRLLEPPTKDPTSENQEGQNVYRSLANSDKDNICVQQDRIIYVKQTEASLGGKKPELLPPPPLLYAVKVQSRFTSEQMEKINFIKNEPHMHVHE